MIDIKKAVDLLLEDKELYKECGDLFKYLIDVKTNIKNIDYHNLSWQLAQAVEISYSNRLINNNLNIFDVIIAYSTTNLKESKEKKYIKPIFETTIIASDYRRANKELKLEVIDLIRENIWLKFSKKKVNKIEWEKVLSKQYADIYQAILNGSYSNSPLYLLPLFIYITWEVLKDDKYFWLILSTLINLYLMKNQLIFAPTLPWSYPLLYLQNDFVHTLIEIDSNIAAIKKLAKISFDIIKQASVIIRSFVSTSTLVVSDIENRIQRNKIIKELENHQYNNLLKVLAFDETLFEKVTGIKNGLPIIDEFVRLNMVKVINNENNNTVYMFKDLLNSVKKLNRNKTEKTTKIFILKENLS